MYLLVARTMETTRRLLEQNDGRADVVYMTGGGSELPPVGTVLQAAFGNRVRRSGYTRSATAIGLAIQADSASGYLLKDRLARHFGVWREAEGGRSIVFDPLLEKGISLPQPREAPARVTRRYQRGFHLDALAVGIELQPHLAFEASSTHRLLANLREQLIKVSSPNFRTSTQGDFVNIYSLETLVLGCEA